MIRSAQVPFVVLELLDQLAPLGHHLERETVEAAPALEPVEAFPPFEPVG